MSDYRSLLEREMAQVSVRSFSLDDVARRRDRRSRNRRVIAAVFALILAALAIGNLIVGFGSQRAPASQPITPSNVASLKVAWTSDLGGVGGTPVAADGSVFVATRQGRLSAFPDTCDAETPCPPLWTANTGPTISMAEDPTRGVWVTDGLVLVIRTSPQRLEAYPEGCRPSNGTCAPAWTADVPGGDVLGGTVANGFVYLTSVGGPIYAFRTDCGSGGSACRPTWTASTGRGSLWAPVVDNGTLYATGRDGRAYAFDPATGARLWRGGPIAPIARPIGSTGYSAPVTAGDLVLANLHGTLYAFKASCRGSCDPEWLAPIPDRYSAWPVVAGETVYVATARGPNSGGIDVFPLHCGTGGAVCKAILRQEIGGELTADGPTLSGGTLFLTSYWANFVAAVPADCAGSGSCAPTWTSPQIALPAPPVVIDGVAYVVSDASPGANSIYAFDPSCAPGKDGSCAPTWHWGGFPLAISEPAVAGGKLFVASADGKLYVFSPGGRPTARPGRGTAVFYAVALLLACALLSVRLLRRSRAARDRA